MIYLYPLFSDPLQSLSFSLYQSAQRGFIAVSKREERGKRVGREGGEQGEICFTPTDLSLFLRGENEQLNGVTGLNSREELEKKGED